jgi:hypothetical protein
VDLWDAAEAFLFRRIETLAETKGRFALNVPLPMAFDPTGALEVDLLLQENGYLVLRFLAEDVGKDLDLILDTLVQAVTRRRGR